MLGWSCWRDRIGLDAAVAAALAAGSILGLATAVATATAAAVSVASVMLGSVGGGQKLPELVPQRPYLGGSFGAQEFVLLVLFSCVVYEAQFSQLVDRDERLG